MANYPEWTDDKWAEATERLTLHAQRKLARLCWRGARFRQGGRPPGAPGPEDLAQEAICAVISGDRVWDCAAQPNFQHFLEGVVDSKVSHLAQSVENRRARYTPDALAVVSPSARSPAPQDAITLLDAQERFRSKVLQALDADPQAIRLLECLQAGFTKPAEIAELLGLTVQDVNSAQKRYWRKVEPLIRRCIHDWQ